MANQNPEFNNNSEIDAIKHLLEVEKNASTLIDYAKIEADKRIAEARSKYNSEYKSKYDKIAAELEAAYQKNLESITEKYKSEIEDYKKSLENKPQNEDSFNAFLAKNLSV